MLTIIYGDAENSIYNTNVYFKNTYEPEWFETELAKKMFKDIDDSEVVSGECINSPVLGQIPPERLSGGVKTLLLMLNEPEKIFNASTCGDNCAKWILEIGKQQDSKSIIFLDEGNRFLTSKRFAELVQQSDNYFVLATREKLPMLPYSVNEIYGFRQSGKYHEARQKYNEIYHLYGEISDEDGIDPQFVITEDSNSGYEFFNELSKQKKIKW